MEEGLLSLKWNNHKSTFFQVLSGLREKHTYTDVTLACDGQVYPAHKFVLSTCSEYFSEIFTSTSGTSIVIVLKDVRRQDLEYLMDYMYLGQVDVAQSELPSLIKTAECLRIKGLAIPDDEPHKTQRRGADEREGSPPPSKKKRYLQEDDRHPASSTSTTNNNNNTTSTSSSSSSTSASGRIQMEVLPPPSDLSSLVHLRQPPHSQQPLQAPPPPPPTSQGSSKSHSSQSLSLNLTTQASRTPQGGSSGPHVHTPTSTSAPSSHRPHSSPSHTTPVPVIKEEAADPPETPEGYLNESFEENETKPDVSDPRHLDPDGAVPGPSGLQGSDNWDGDGEMGGYGGSDSYPEGSLEEHGESEVQGAPRPRDGPVGGDAEDFLRRLEDRSQESRLPPPPSGFPALLHPNSGNFTSSVVLTPAAVTFPSQHLYPGSTTTSLAQHPDAASPSLFCSLCPFVTQNVRQLVTHRQIVHMEASQPRRSTSLQHPPPPSRVLSAEETDQRVFKCPYCDVKEKGREAIKNHVITHSLGEEGPDRLYWCSFCTLKCRSAPGLASHMKRHEVQGDC